ncbi:MAG: hypothetical protein WBH04_07845 [Albidovulum sp.]
MQKSYAWQAAALMLAMIVIWGGAPLVKGAYYLGKHEGDTLHMAEIVVRMARGEWPHLDFMTPIGVLAAAPIMWFVKIGAGLGHAFFYAQILVALVLAPAVLRVVNSRIAGMAGLGYAFFVMVLCLALVHGEAEPAVSISMHYNRWAWAIAYIVVPLVMLAPREGQASATLDGVIIGLGMAALLLIKATYFAALAPGILTGLLVRRWWGALGAAALAGLVVAGVVTALAGMGFWLAYLGDMLTVAGSDVRPQPGAPLAGVAGAPAYMGASLTILAAVIFLRQAGRMTEGLLLLVLMPGFYYIVFQNFGNDPQWLLMLALFAFVLRPAAGMVNSLGWDLRQGLTICAVLAVAFGFPSAMNLAYSPFRHLFATEEKMVPLLSGLPQHQDILTGASRIYGVLELRQGDGPGSPYEDFREISQREDKPVLLNGEALAYCEQQSGPIASFEEMARDLEAAGYAGKRLLVADLISGLWLYGDFEPVRGAAPWYYGGLSGVENADYVVIPLCPTSAKVRGGMITSLEEGGYSLHEERRTRTYILIKAEKAG